VKTRKSSSSFPSPFPPISLLLPRPQFGGIPLTSGLRDLFFVTPFFSLSFFTIPPSEPPSHGWSEGPIPSPVQVFSSLNALLHDDGFFFVLFLPPTLCFCLSLFSYITQYNFFARVPMGKPPFAVLKESNRRLEPHAAHFLFLVFFSFPFSYNIGGESGAVGSSPSHFSFIFVLFSRDAGPCFHRPFATSRRGRFMSPR